jgi:hypothetical protein
MKYLSNKSSKNAVAQATVDAFVFSNTSIIISNIIIA